MCIVNHAVPGNTYLIQSHARSIAPPDILQRLLAYYKEIELTDGQLHRLLDVKRGYREKYAELCAKIELVVDEIDQLVNSRDTKAKQLYDKIDEHAELFKQHERFFADTVIAVNGVLTAKQHQLLIRRYEKEKQAFLAKVQKPLVRALAPQFSLRVSRR